MSTYTQIIYHIVFSTKNRAPYLTKTRLMAYINAQQEHHRQKTYGEELKELLHEAGVTFDDSISLEFNPASKRPLWGWGCGNAYHRSVG